MAKLDRITEALERAQAQELGGAPADSVFRVNPGPLTPVVHKAEFLRGLPGRSAIVYNKTRVANVPRDELIRSRIVVDGADPALTNAIKLLRTQIVQKMRERGWRTLAIVSPDEGEGKSFMASNFAVSMAAEFDQTVLLLDADLRRPTIHHYFGLSGDPGLSDFLVRRAPLHSILINPGIERLVILPAGTPQANSAELLGSTEMAALMADVKARYSDRIVVVDLPPLLRSADALAFAPLVDAMVMVVEDNHSRRDDIVRAHQLLTGVNLMGVVLNKSRESRSDAPYGRPNGRDPGFPGRLFKRD
jgi:protein-tyrosine kinase